MVACFFCRTGHVAIVLLEHSRTVNSEWYTTICLPKVFGAIRKANKRRRIIVPHDNANSYTSVQTSVSLTDQNVEFMGHPPYSPDLAPNDFSLFPHIKKNAWSTIFVKNHVLEVSQSEWKNKHKWWPCTKFSEYRYAKKCQIFLWKCQISSGSARNLCSHRRIRLTWKLKTQILNNVWTENNNQKILLNVQRNLYENC